jgi:uncharacterized protein
MPYIFYLHDMKTIYRTTVVAACLLALLSTACSQRKQQAPPAAAKRDTIYVPMLVSEAVKDSLAKIVRDSMQEGEFVSSAYKIVMPLLPTGYVNDYIGLFNPAQVATLDSMISQYEKETTNEVAILTIDTSWTPKASFDEFVLRVHNSWGVGKKDKNNGIVIGICPGYRVLRISNGYGIEPKLSDTETKAIIDEQIRPEYAKGNYFEGTRKGLQAIINKVK